MWRKHVAVSNSVQGSSEYGQGITEHPATDTPHNHTHVNLRSCVFVRTYRSAFTHPYTYPCTSISHMQLYLVFVVSQRCIRQAVHIYTQAVQVHTSTAGGVDIINQALARGRVTSLPLSISVSPSHSLACFSLPVLRALALALALLLSQLMFRSGRLRRRGTTLLTKPSHTIAQTCFSATMSCRYTRLNMLDALDAMR